MKSRSETIFAGSEEEFKSVKYYYNLIGNL